MFFRWLRRLWMTLLLLTVAAMVALFVNEEAPPQGNAGPNAQALLQKVAEATHLKQWYTTKKVVSWKSGRNRYTLDSIKNRLQCNWTNEGSVIQVNIEMLSQHVLVLQDNKAVEGKQRQQLAVHCHKSWKRDYTWLNPAIQLFMKKEPKIVQRGSEQALLLVPRFASPDRSIHLFHLDKLFRPKAWQQWGKQTLVQGMKVGLTDWTRYHGNLLLSRTRTTPLGKTTIQGIQLTTSLESLSLNNPFKTFEDHQSTRSVRKIFTLVPTKESSISLWKIVWQWFGILVVLGLLLWWFKGSRSGTVRFPSPKEHPLRYGYIRPEILSLKQCKELIQAAEAIPWTTNRHTQPTQDQPLQSLGAVGETYDRFLRDEVFPLVASSYTLNQKDLDIRESFVVKYDEHFQQKLDLHRDASIITVIVALNDAKEYKGGGTYFPSLGRIITLKNAGDVFLHCGKLQHGGYPVLQGQRYLLVSFLDCSRCPEFNHEEIQTWDSAGPPDKEVMNRIYNEA